MIMKKIIIGAFVFLLVLSAKAQPLVNRVMELQSPDKKLKLQLEIGKSTRYALWFNNKPVILPSAIGMSLDKMELGTDVQVKKSSKKSKADDNELTIHSVGYDMAFKVHNEGMAYRFITHLKDSVKVLREQANFNLEGKPAAILQETDNYTVWEGVYVKSKSIADLPEGKRATTPALFDDQSRSIKVVVAESDVTDYPGMYIQKHQQQFRGEWAKYPSKIELGSWGNFVSVVKERENFLAKTTGNRAYPWRVVMVTDDDKQLLNNHLIAKLAKPNVIKNTKWIKPGKATWEWWHDAMLPGANIPSGMDNRNTALYNYYVDFAADHQLEYLMIDAGWSDNYNVTKMNPKLDVRGVIKRAEQKNVGVFLWCVATTLMNDLDKNLDFIRSLGAKGIKVDFFDRDDQLAMQWMEQIAKSAAERELMINFHGCTKPSGMEVTYPNIVNYEAVRGAESDKWDYTNNPNHHLIIPFTRMLVGPMDYTPGAMRNKTKAQFKPIDPGLPSGQGTRAHELAMFVMYNQPFAMLADSPTEYVKYKDIMRYLSAVPTIFDQTVPLSAKIGEYVLMAKRKDSNWFIGAMTNWTERSMVLDFSFLKPGITYTAEIYTDGKDANVNAEDYDYRVIEVNSTTKIDLKLASGGGTAAYVYPKN